MGKRPVIALLCILAGAAVSLGAGGKNEVTGTIPAPQQAAGGAAKLVIWDIQTTTALKQQIDASAEKFKKDNAGVEVEVVHVQNDPYKTKIKVAMGAGSPPDIFHNWGGGSLKAYIDAGLVMPLDPLKPRLEKFIPASFNPVTFDGKLYAIPYGGLNGVFFWYRSDIFARLKLTPPKTWAELLAVCDALKANGIIPISLANQTKWPGSFYYMYLADRIGGETLFSSAFYKKNNVTFQDPSYVKAGQFLQELVKRGCFPQGFNGMSYDTGQSRTLTYTGKAGMELMLVSLLNSALTEAPDVVKDLDFFVFPSLPEGKGNPTNLIGSPGQNYFSISNPSQNKQLAVKFLTEYIMNDEYVTFMGNNAYIPPIKNASQYIKQPLYKKVAQTFEQANSVQLYYDQFMPPAMADKHKDLVQALFALSMTPEQIAAEHDKALQAESAAK